MSARRIQAAGFLLGLGGLAIVVVRTAGEVEGTVLPGRGALALGFALAVASLLAAGRSWVALLLAGEERSELLGALYLSQLSKYLPAGGLVQAAGQVSLSVRATIPMSRVAVAYPIAMAEVVAMGMVLAAGLVLVPDIPLWARAVAAVAPVGVLVLEPRVLRVVLALGRRIWRRVPDASSVPGRRAIATSTAWALLNIAATSSAFVVLLRSIEPDVSVVGAFSGFAAAWVIGFLVVPVPSGLGVREAVLLVAVPGLEPGQLLAAALAHRIVTVLAEVLVTAANAAARHRRREVPQVPELPGA